MPGNQAITGAAEKSIPELLQDSVDVLSTVALALASEGVLTERSVSNVYGAVIIALNGIEAAAARLSGGPL
jgi:hypothetical protein